MVTIIQIRTARNNKVLNWLEKRAKRDKEEIVRDPRIKDSIKRATRKDYMRKIKAIRIMRKRVKE